MKTALTLLLVLAMLPSCFAQAASAKWQVATILDIKAQPAAAGDDAPANRYYVTVRVENTEYVVLYVPPDATLKDMLQYHPGGDGLVLVGAETIKYNDMLGRTREVPIVSSRAVAVTTTEKKPDNKH